jgi:hypothetical protein
MIAGRNLFRPVSAVCMPIAGLAAFERKLLIHNQNMNIR